MENKIKPRSMWQKPLSLKKKEDIDCKKNNGRGNFKVRMTKKSLIISKE